jgi:hypothetical protein
MSSIDYSKTISELHKAIVELNYKNKMDIANIQSVIDGTAFRSSSIDRSKGIGSRHPYVPEDKPMITLHNPEKLNTNDRLIAGEWGVTYGGRDLSIDEDNYGWIITNRVTGERGFYIVERELVQRDWLNVRWGNGDSKERKELIDKSRLANMGQIRRDMIKAVMNTK